MWGGGGVREAGGGGGGSGDGDREKGPEGQQAEPRRRRTSGSLCVSKYHACRSLAPWGNHEAGSTAGVSKAGEAGEAEGGKGGGRAAEGGGVRLFQLAGLAVDKQRDGDMGDEKREVQGSQCAVHPACCQSSLAAKWSFLRRSVGAMNREWQ